MRSPVLVLVLLLALAGLVASWWLYAGARDADQAAHAEAERDRAVASSPGTLTPPGDPDARDAVAPVSTDLTAVEAQAEPIGAVARAGARIRGEVYRPDGAPAAGRLLRFSLAQQGQLLQVEADGEGRFLAEELVAGRWRIDTFPDKDELLALGDEGGGLGGFEHLATETVDVADGEEAYVVLGLPSGSEVSVHGRVLLGAEPVAAILQWVRLGTGGGQGMVMGRSGADGTYEVRLAEPGAYEASVTVLGPPRGRAELPVDVPAAREHERDLVLPSGSISGRVFAPDGAPLADAILSLRVVEGARHRSPLAMPGDFQHTDDEGRYAFSVLEPGTYSVAAQGWAAESGDPAWAAAVRSDVVLSVGARLEDVNFRLESGRTLSGFVLDADGEPAAGAAVFVFDASGRLVNPIAATHSSAEGWFATRPLADGRHELVARWRDRTSEPLPVEVAPGRRDEVELVLSTGADLIVEWSAADADPRRLVPFVQVTDLDGRRWGGLRDQRQPFDWREDRADPHLPRIGPLPRGTYRVVAALPDGRRGTAEVTLTGPGEQRVRLLLE